MPGVNTKDRLIKAAIEITAETGIENVTVKKIAERLGLAEATMYRHFSGIDELLCEAMITADTRVMNVCIREYAFGKSKGMPFSEIMFRVWHQLMRSLLNHSNETIYLIRFRYSSMYSPDIRARRKANNGTLENMLIEFAEETGKTLQATKTFIWYVWRVTLCQAENVIVSGRSFELIDEACVWNGLVGSFNNTGIDGKIVIKKIRTVSDNKEQE